MKKLLVYIGILATSAAFAVPHLDLEMTSVEYRSHLAKLPANKSKNSDPEIEASLKLGARLSKWIETINAARPAASAIRLTSAQTRRGIPIDKPSIYSPSIIKAEVEQILKNLPASMKKVLLGADKLPTVAGQSDETFITHARLLDKNYQSAARYKLVNVYRDYYIQAAASDIRGYYYLSQNKITANELKEVSAIDGAKLPAILDALTKICANGNHPVAECRDAANRALKNNQLAMFYKQYFEDAKLRWNNFFVIPDYGVRSDLVWNGNTLEVPFNTPTIAKFIPYLQNNIEDEFRFGNWALKMNFGNYADGPVLIFKPGVVPHVNGLGGNEIVMDSNQPIEEYESQWTIRHEFGHVLGLPDCYHEFYDETLKAYVNYQLDISDLMCSRAGNMKERIYNELHRVYGPI